MWCSDEAGPYQTVPLPGVSWQPMGEPARYPHEYSRNGTAKLLTLFRPRDGTLRVKGVPQTTNAVLHTWLKAQLTEIVAALPPHPPLTQAELSGAWARWLLERPPATELAALPPLRVLLVMDNLAGHKTPDFVVWCAQHGILPLYTPLGGSWLNMAESIQRILKYRALVGTYPQTPEAIITALEAVAAAWNQRPTPFLWGGKRATRRARARLRRQAMAGSGACVRKLPPRPRRSNFHHWRWSSRMTH